MSEALRSSLLVEPQERLDSAQFGALQSADSWASETYTKLTVQGDFDTQMAEFDAHGTNPDLRATHLDVAELEQEHNTLLQFKGALLEDPDVPQRIRQAYRWKVNELLGNVRMAQASRAGDMRRFAAYNAFIYGVPDPGIFAATADWFRHDATQQLRSEHASVREAASAVLELVADQDGSREALIPDPDTFAKVRADHYAPGGHYALLFAGVTVPEAGKINREVGDPILEAVRGSIGADDYEIADASGATWGARNGARQLLRPARYDMPRERFIGLGPGHEWTHVLEYINGLRGPLALAGIGLDRYESGNEGRSLLREQVVYSSFDDFAKLLRWQDVLRREYSIALGWGSDGTPRSFGEVYAAVNAVDTLWERVKNPSDITAADAKARSRTRALLKRTLKGTDGNGGAYLKDIVYLQGNVAAWKTAAADPKAIERGDRAKYDISNNRHIGLLEEYGVIPLLKADKEML